MSRLKVIAKEKKTTSTQTKSVLRHEIVARFESLWKNSPDTFDPEKNPLELIRIQRTKKLIKKHVDANGLQVIDLGCGVGTLASWLQKKGASLLATDAASLALEKLPKGLEHQQEVLPITSLKSDFYDLVLFTDVICYLPKHLYRLSMSEIARLVKKSGHIILSTPLDRHSEDALETFVSLVQTEFEIVDLVTSSHAIALKLEKLFKINNLKIILFLEKFSKALCYKEGVSHVIVIAKKKRLF